MPTNSVILAISGLPSKDDRKVGYSFSANTSFSSGTRPKVNSAILSVSLYLNSINVYTSCNLDFGNVGVVALSTQSGDASFSGGLSGFDADTIRALAINGGSLSGTVTKNGSYGGNALNFRSTVGSLTIQYEDSTASTGSLNSIKPQQGETVILSINKADASYVHTVTWKSSSGQTVTQNAGSAASASFTIPGNWSTGSATCTLTTKTEYGETVGSVVLSFNIQLNTSVIYPTAGALSISLVQTENAVPASWNVYVKGFSKAELSLPNASAGTNASIQSINFTCGAQLHSSENGKTWITDVLTETGALDCNASVTNSYGNTTDADTQQILVYDYADPQLSSIVAFRCLQNGNASDSGAYISVKASVSYSTVGNKNSLVSFSVQYKKSTDSNWSTAETLTSGTALIIGGDLDTGTYQVRVIAIDQIQNLRGTYTEDIETVMTSDYTIHCLDGGYNVSFGMQGTIPMAIQLNPNWDFYHGTQKVNLGEPLVTESKPTPNSTNPVQAGGTYDMIVGDRPNKLSATIPVSYWLGTGPFYIAFEADCAANSTIIASPYNEASARAMGAGILIAPNDGYLYLETSVIPSNDLTLVITILPNQSDDGSPFFVSKRGGGGGDYDEITRFLIVDGAFNNIVDLPNMLILSGSTVIAVFEASFDSKSMASGDSEHILTVPEDYRPFIEQSFTGRRWDAGNTESTLPITVLKNGTVKINNNTGSSFSFNRMRFFESWQRKQARMIGLFYNDGTGPASVAFFENEITLDTVNNTVTYKVDVSWPSYSLIGSNNYFIRFPKGFGPNERVTIKNAAIYRTSGTEYRDDALYISRNGDTVYWSIAFDGSRGFAFELTTDAYQEYIYKFITFSRTNVVFNTNHVEINPSTGKVRYQLDATFDAVTASNYSYGTEIGFAVDVYAFRPKSLPGEYFEGIATKSNGEQITVQCSLRGASYSSSYACSLYVKTTDMSVLYGTQITGISIDYETDAYGY